MLSNGCFVCDAARKPLMPRERGSEEIKLAYMAEYYGSL